MGACVCVWGGGDWVRVMSIYENYRLSMTLLERRMKRKRVVGNSGLISHSIQVYLCLIRLVTLIIELK